MKRQLAIVFGALSVSSFSMMVGTVATGASPTVAQTTEDSWLETETSNWNRPGATVPSAPPQAGDNLPYCADSPALREAMLPEDEAIKAAGWTLYGSAQVFGSTTVVTAMANADGMCRPMAYQAFVFHNQQFVGTLSPTAMDSRTEASLRSYNLYGENRLLATFNRYTAEDAMCCPSGETYVDYQIETQEGAVVLVPDLPDPNP